MWRRKQLEYTWLRTLMDAYQPFSVVTAEALDFACEDAGLTPTTSMRKDLMDQYQVLAAFPGVPETLAQLSQQFSLSILSNANPEMLTAAAAFNGIDKSLDHIFSADATARFKPTPEVYALAVNGLGLSPHQIAFISSNTWDVAGASAFGFFAIWLNRNEGTMETMGYAPALILNDFSALSKK